MGSSPSKSQPRPLRRLREARDPTAGLNSPPYLGPELYRLGGSPYRSQGLHGMSPRDQYGIPYGFRRNPRYLQGGFPDDAPVIPSEDPVIPNGRIFFRPVIPDHGLVTPSNGPVIPPMVEDDVRAEQLRHSRGSSGYHENEELSSSRERSHRRHRGGSSTSFHMDDPPVRERSHRRRRSSKSQPRFTIRLAFGDGQDVRQRRSPEVNNPSPPPPPPVDSPDASPDVTPSVNTRPVQERVPTPFHPPAGTLSPPRSSRGSRTPSSSHPSILSSPTRDSRQTSLGTSVDQHASSSPQNQDPQFRLQSPPFARRHNPLPEPPRDIYSMTPYKHLLTPQELPLTPPENRNQGMFVRKETIVKKKQKGGLLRVFSSKKSKPEETRTVEYLYYPPNGNPPYHNTPGLGAGQTMGSEPGPSPPSTSTQQQQLFTTVHHPEQQSWDLGTGAQPPAQSQRVHIDPGPSRSPVSVPRQDAISLRTSVHSHPQPLEAVASAAEDVGAAHHRENRQPSWPPLLRVNAHEPIYFDQDSEYSSFLLHSAYPILYEGKEYPTATHLLEALKYLPTHPEVAEIIRLCEDSDDLYNQSAKYTHLEKPDYGVRIVDNAEIVLSMKFRQHADLRYQLSGTAPAELRYNDPSDSFWGIGPDGDGQNELGRLLERIRKEMLPPPKALAGTN